MSHSILASPHSRLILASQSPRRSELLSRLGLGFEVRPADICEDSAETDPAALVLALASEKAHVVAAQHPDASVIAADTTVALHNEILGKPKDAAENAAYIAKLSGQWHTVFTALAVFHAGHLATHVEATRVKFRTLEDWEISGYAASGEGLDKAGGYGIQALGMALVERIDGDYFNVVGLPIVALVKLARTLGLELLPWAFH